MKQALYPGVFGPNVNRGVAIDRSARMGIKKPFMSIELWWGVVVSLTMLHAAAAQPIVSPDLNPPHYHKEPVIVADSAGDHLVAAWINLPGGNRNTAEVQISRSSVSQPFNWSDPYPLALAGGSGDPYLAADPTPGSHTVYIATVSGNRQEIVLWTDDGINRRPSVVSQVELQSVDKPSVAASANTLYVVYLLGDDSIVIHTRPRGIDTAQWTKTTLKFNFRAPDGRVVTRELLHSPLILVQDVDATEKVTIVVEDYKVYEFLGQASNLKSKSNSVLAWTVSADLLRCKRQLDKPETEHCLFGETKNINPKNVDPSTGGGISPDEQSAPGGYAVHRISRLMFPDGEDKRPAQLPNTEFRAESMLMAQGTMNPPTIGVVWHEREAFDDTSETDARFIAYDPSQEHFIGICDPQPIGADFPCESKSVASDCPVTAGNQFHPAIATNEAGDFLVTYYESTPIGSYNVKASLLSAAGDRRSRDIVVPHSNWSPGSYTLPIGEYQGITYSVGHWYAAFINLSTRDGILQADTSVEMIPEIIENPTLCCDSLPRRVSVEPRLASRTDHPVVAVFGEWEGIFHYDWYERLPEETTPRLLYKHTSSISVTPSQPLTYYSAVVRNACGQTASLAEVPVYLCVPTIDTQPADQVVPRGGSTDLTVAASPAIAGQPVTYTWWSYDTGQIVGSGPTLRVTPTPGTTQVYYAIVNTDCSGLPFGKQTRAAVVTGCALAATASSDRNIALGQTVTLTSSISGAQAPYDAEYTWYYGPAPGTEYASGVGLWAITPPTQTTTTYWVRVKDGTCIADSNPVTLRVCVPVITSQPQGTTIRAGQTATLSVGVAPLANETVQYQWFAGASGDVSHPVSGVTPNPSFTTSALSATTSYWVRVTSSCGATTDSVAAVVTVCNNPVISGVTPTRYIRYGGSASHQVSATGNSLTYQWYTGSPGNTSAPVQGATQSSISQAPSATTTYWARVTSYGLCTTDSPAMVIDVCTDPPITTQPASKTINSGQSAALNVATSATGATYQWYLGTGAAIQGATSSSLTVTPTADTQYFAQVTRGACTSTSDTATLTVCSLATSLSGGTNIALGQSATLTAIESGSRSQPTNYEWYAGTGASSYVIASGAGLWQKTVTPSVTTQYWVRISDGICIADSTPVTVSVCKPTITAQPQGKTVNSGQTATLSVTATGAPLSYQWYIGAAGNTAQPIQGATSATYTTPPMSATTSYWVRVTGCTTADSLAATVNVCAPPAITSGPIADSQRIPGTIGKMTVTATGTGLTYQWFTGQSGDTTVPVAGSGCNTAQCSFSLSASKYYWVRIIGTCGTLNSPAVLHPVSPTIVQQPQSASVPPNATPTLSLTASGTDLTYQWYRGSTGNTAVPVSGATAATFTVPPVTAPVSYWCRVTSRGDTTAITDSAEATLSFCTGPSIYGLMTQYLGYNQWRLWIGFAEEDLGNIYCAWYTGVPGNVAQSVLQYEGSHYTDVTATGTQTWWCRAWYIDNSCYTDSLGATIYKVQ